ncbi:hypothetical protein AOLI_G00025210 [Acnodon oligacanthus]
MPRQMKHMDLRRGNGGLNMRKRMLFVAVRNCAGRRVSWSESGGCVDPGFLSGLSDCSCSLAGTGRV